MFDTQTRNLINFNVYPAINLHIAFDRGNNYILFGSGGDQVYESDYDKFYESNISRVALNGAHDLEVIATIGTVSSMYGGGPISPAI